MISKCGPLRWTDVGLCPVARPIVRGKTRSRLIMITSTGLAITAEAGSCIIHSSASPCGKRAAAMSAEAAR